MAPEGASCLEKGAPEAELADLKSMGPQEILQMAAKLEATRKLSVGVSLSEAVDCDIEDEDFTPHFQRVYISGDDNTGVSNFRFIFGNERG